MGEYDDEKIPEGVSFPLHIDVDNSAICFENNEILSRYAGATIEESVMLLEKRKAEFVVKVANGELIVRKDKKGADRIFKRSLQSIKSGKIVIEYEEIKMAVPA